MNLIISFFVIFLASVKSDERFGGTISRYTEVINGYTVETTVINNQPEMNCPFDKDTLIKVSKQKEKFNPGKKIGVYFGKRNEDRILNLRRLIKIIKLFSKNDTFDVKGIYNFNDSYDGYILPGGNGNITNLSSSYWAFVNATVLSGKPVFGICLGFQHLVKKFFPEIKQNKCYLYTTLLDNRYHNHKWCIRASNDYISLLSQKFKLGTYKYQNRYYIGALQGDRIYATINHPELQSRLSSEDNFLINSFLSSL